MGQNHRTESAGKIHLHHNVERDERVVRTVVLPALFAGNDFLVPERFVIAFDGSATGPMAGSYA